MATPTVATCLLGETSNTARSIVYPTTFFAAVPLQLGRTYVAVLTAQRADGGFLGFASREFTPSTEPAPVGSGIRRRLAPFPRRRPQAP